MIIRSMTATFGKLDHETLVLEPGLNILQAPNEWGKSTWCAFLTAMFYGIETRVHTTKSVLADKERYAPWSGSPMEGRLELTWQGRNITIERRTKGKTPFSVFRAYETDTGLDIPELTAANCGQTFLGVEKSVFLRAGFIRMADLPVAQDEALRKRLNALVTTGEESGSAEALAQQLRELKNRCRANRSTGLLPQCQARCQELEQTLEELRSLRDQSQRHRERLEQLEQHRKALENHQAALEYEAGRSYTQKLREAREAQDAAAARLSAQEALCASLPQPDLVERTLLRVSQLRDTREALLLELQMLSPAVEDWEPHPVFRDLEPEKALSQAELEHRIYEEDSRKRPFPWYWLLLALLGAAVTVIPHWAGKVFGILTLFAGLALFFSCRADRRRRKNTVQALLDRYAPLPPEQWLSAAEDYARRRTRQQEAQARFRHDREELNSRLADLDRELSGIDRARWEAARQDYGVLSEATREYRRAADLVRTLEGSHRDAPPPAFPDTMTYTAQETARLLSDCAYEQRQLQLKLGTLLGRMETMGSEDTLLRQLEAEQARLAALEDTYSALELAQDTLAQASAQLQRRFAPGLSQRAQALFSRLTGGRYTRLSLSEDLSLQAGAQNESTLRSALWRSDGTADQLYLALRLALSEALTPDAPLVLDDALVRFDDKRLAEALDVLAEESETKQVILFTCQGREAALRKA